MPSGWEELPDHEHGQVWDRFEATFSFRPSVNPAKWPGIVEPTPSVTADWLCPNGDYYIYLSADLSLGTFGHPWEASLCVWGDQLIDAVAAVNRDGLTRILRRDGVAKD
jgi:hypothetical protein